MRLQQPELDKFWPWKLCWFIAGLVSRSVSPSNNVSPCVSCSNGVRSLCLLRLGVTGIRDKVQLKVRGNLDINTRKY